MTLDEIKAAVDAGKTVQWGRVPPGSRLKGHWIEKDQDGKYWHVDAHGFKIALSQDGQTPMGYPEDYHIAD